MEKNKAIEIQDLVIDYGNSIAVNKINLQVEKGDLVTLLGPSGCGKSTTLNALAGLITTTSGKIYFEGRNVTRFSPKERDIGLVFQSYALYPHMTVYKNIAFPLMATDKFEKESKKKNEEIDFEILKFKYEKSGAKDFEKISKDYLEYKLLTEERNKELETIEYKTNNATKNAKEAKSVIKIQKDGKIKSISEEALSLIVKNEEYIDDIKKQANLIKSSEASDDQKETELNKLRERISMLEESNKAIFQKHTEDIKEIKNKYKEDLNFVKSEKKRILSEVKEWRVSEIEKVNKKFSNLDSSLKEKSEISINKIKDIANNVSLNEKDLEELRLLENKKVPWKVALDKKVREVAERVGITDQLEKKVTALSGGQQQRVAISRTLVKNPKVLLLDEPLSNLDAKMRVQTREWIRNLQQELGITTIFVTHDQEEAMSISDKIVCMSNGHIQQVAEPMDMYHNPTNKFVAGFLGMPQMNFVEVETPIGEKFLNLTKNKKAHSFGIRPEHVKLVKEVPKSEIHTLTLDGKVLITESFGREKLVTATVGEGTIKFFTEIQELDRGDEVKIGFKKDKIYIFDNEGMGNTIGRK